MTTSKSGFTATVAHLFAEPLDFAERTELLRLRQCNLRLPQTTFASERDELTALRASLEQELEEVRALTTKDWPLPYAVEPVAELYWRRPLAERKRQADKAAAEAAKEEKDRKKREADEERLTYLRQKRDHDRALARRMAAEHTTLTAIERKEQDTLRKNWAEHDALGEEPETEPIFSCPGDCGRKHLSPSAAAACANVRRREAEPRTQVTASERVHAPTTPAPPRPTPRPAPTNPAPSPPRPSPTSSTATRPAPTRSNPPTDLATARPAPTPRAPTPSTAARPAPTLHLVPGTGPSHPVPRTSGTGSRPVPVAREPVPTPRSGTTLAIRDPVLAQPSATSPRRASILEAVRSSPTPLSANAIATTVGGRKAAVLDEVRALVRDGLLVPTEGGLTLAR